ncbi:D-alanyl-D-alanine carboxypeptidase [Leuconostoc pseudomesenteroides]|uniref:D-alanyl-D-alanine carboxypeptidase family protein n=1 Tax=Leuconostoc pseudomesenteroides TaxID=33968 RepID=UPI0021A98ECF|nr:serine hydrolase [Leuconostoc pseudomesenteroides]MCT4388449.1 D-alanyl-D-alanine carboxypeptidase [Leuconostoc pseudomesenteroides]
MKRNQTKLIIGGAVILLIGLIVGLSTSKKDVSKPTNVKHVTDKPINLSVNATSAVVIDAKTGQVLGVKNADKQVSIASQTKMLTAYGVLQGIKSGKIKWTTKVPITSKSDLSDQDSHLFSHIAVKAGDKLSVKELYDVMFANSANDAAFALGEFMTPKGKTTQQALQMWAKSLHLTGSQWYNSAGQVNGDAFENQVKSASKTAANHATAKQLAMIAKADLALDPTLRKLSEKLTVSYHLTPSYVVTDKTDYWQLMTQTMPKLSNPNKLVIEGLKTGSTPESGAAFTGIIKDQNGHEFITVVNGAGDYMDEKTRYQATLDVVNEVLAKKQGHTFTSNQTIQNIKFKALKKTEVPVKLAETKTFWTSKKTQLKLSNLSVNTKLAKLNKNQTIGYISPALDAQYLPYTPKTDKQLIVKSGVKGTQANWFVRLWRNLF